jgi:hypothetical protein
MNVKLIRNLLLTGAMCTTAALLPVKTTQAQTCPPNCACEAYCYTQYGDCVTAGGGTECGTWLSTCLATCG